MYAKVRKEKAEEVRGKLIEKESMDSSRRILRDGDYVLFPVKGKPEIEGVEYLDLRGEAKVKKPKSLKEALAKSLNEKQISQLPSAFDVVGDIAVVELPEELIKWQGLIGDALIKTFKNIKVAALKRSSVSSEYRTRKIEVIAGEERTVTVHKENGCVFELDIQDVYFSPRLSGERLRVAEKIKPGERVLVLFAGIGPYAVLAAKKTNKQVVAVELNPQAVHYMKANARRNKVNLKIIRGDAGEVTPNLGKFDRIIMPLPKDAGDFLDAVLPAITPNGVIHFYSFSHDLNEAKNSVTKKAEKLGYSIKIIDAESCGSYSPCLSRTCVDFQVTQPLKSK